MQETAEGLRLLNFLDNHLDLKIIEVAVSESCDLNKSIGDDRGK